MAGALLIMGISQTAIKMSKTTKMAPRMYSLILDTPPPKTTVSVSSCTSFSLLATSSSLGVFCSPSWICLQPSSAILLKSNFFLALMA